MPEQDDEYLNDVVITIMNSKNFPKNYKRGTIEMYEPEKKINPGDYNSDCAFNHAEFFPISKLEDINKRYKELNTFIKASAKLTVKVNAKMTKREIENDDLRTGTGMICAIIRKSLEDPLRECHCFKCLISDTPRNVVGEIIVSTSRSVIDNDYEARNATFRLNYDGEDSDCVFIDGCNLAKSESNKEVKVRCLTCDENLINTLQEKLNDWNDLKLTYGTNEKLQQFKFVIAHPHGCSKHVYINNDQTDFKKCTGSSGAVVLTKNNGKITLSFKYYTNNASILFVCNTLHVNLFHRIFFFKSCLTFNLLEQKYVICIRLNKLILCCLLMS
ncbi:unnamed protein product [Lymnaea stagnalis]|uniref:Uncharacterized protein n=1 Tax=Lymnaea stagnalis TaxID=6523 RepID=A0AAV2I6X4_LYMST